jgi:hypothetical protein
MKKIILIGICLFGILSCEDNQDTKVDQLIDNQFKGAVFEDWDEFFEYHISLENMEDEFEILHAISGKNYGAFLETAIETNDVDKLKIADELTYGLMAILNNNLEFMVGNNIVSYKDGAFFELDSITGKLSKIENLEVSIINFEQQNKSLDNDAKLYIYGTNTGGYSDKDFWRNAYYRCSDNAKILGPSSRQMRYTQQLKAVYSGDNAILYIETKLYWRNSSNDLRYATTEERNYTYNITGTVGKQVFGPGGWHFASGSINFQKTVNCTKSKWNRQQIASVYPTEGNKPWEIDLTGTITHHINGDLSNNKWYAPVYWK